MANTPILGLPYPLGSNPPAGNLQIENLARQSELWMVYRFADAADRNSTLAGVEVDGMVCYLKDRDVLQVRKGGSWTTLVDDSMGLQSSAEQSNVTETWSSTAGTETPSGGEKIQVASVVPDSGLLLVMLSSIIRVGGNNQTAWVGFRVKTVTGDPSGAQTLIDVKRANSAFSATVNYTSGGWQRVVNVGANRAGQTVYTALFQQVGANGDQGQALSRSLTVIPVR